ncbi:MAG: hypothetical protein A07HR60_01615 [uncultured archaeon A07HR60]|nr:MAG: hypothetical protein A07HR60_01615 [uncultured archaeon A07HR60]
MVLNVIKQILGIENSTREDEDSGTTVAVEHDPGETTTTGASIESREQHDDEDGSVDDSVTKTDSEPASSGETVHTEETAPSGETAESETESPSDTDDSAEQPVEEVKGIGPAYAEQLANIGVETVTQLAAADPEEIGEETSVGESRAATWVSRATEQDSA